MQDPARSPLTPGSLEPALHNPEGPEPQNLDAETSTQDVFGSIYRTLSTRILYRRTTIQSNPKFKRLPYTLQLPMNLQVPCKPAPTKKDCLPENGLLPRASDGFTMSKLRLVTVYRGFSGWRVRGPVKVHPDGAGFWTEADQVCEL